MRKFALIFVLSLLILLFLLFFINVFNFNNKNKPTPVSETIINNTTIVPSLYTDYSKVEYDKALFEKRILVVFFTSNWCASCSDQDVVNKTVLDSLTTQGVVGLKAHILDSETTIETDALARKFDITKENSLVILDENGVVVFKYIGNLSKEMLRQQLEGVISK